MNKTNMEIRLLGFVCMNEADPGDNFACQRLAEITIRPGVDSLPIIDEERVKNPSFTTVKEGYKPRRNNNEVKTTTSAGGSSTVAPASLFFDNYVTAHHQTTSASPADIFVSTNGRVVREILGCSSETKYSTTQWNFNVKLWEGNKCVMFADKSSQGREYSVEFGIHVENYLKKDRKKNYKVFSVHAIHDRKQNVHYIYSAEIDGFLLSREGSLTPVEVKCIDEAKYKQNSYRPDYELQVQLGQIHKVLLAIYQQEAGSNRIRIAECKYDELSPQDNQLRNVHQTSLSNVGKYFAAHVRRLPPSDSAKYLKMMICKGHHGPLISISSSNA